MIIKSLLDTDLYKFTMMQLVFHQYPKTIVEYRFKCRTSNIDLIPYVKAIQSEIEKLCQLKLQAEELDYLQSLDFIKSDFVDFLRTFQLNKDFVHINVKNGFELMISGPWLLTILFEVPLLAIISEIYSRSTLPNPDYDLGKKKLAEKIQAVKTRTPSGEFKLVEFGTRRRYSFVWQEHIIQTLQKELPDNLLGTSSVYYAKQFNLRPIGTMAHEYIQAFQVLAPTLIDSQRFALEAWANEYQGALGIALSDTYNIDIFLKDFDLYLAKLYDGTRQDSGNPFSWGEKIIAHYEKMGIDPLSKTIVFSDSLTFDLAIDIFWRFKAHIKPIFGIGTNLTNDLGNEAIQIVIKMTGCNGKPVAKLSDSPTKTLSHDQAYLDYLKQVFNITSIYRA